MTARRAGLDSVGAVAGPVNKGGADVEVLDGIALHGGRAASWPGGLEQGRTILARIGILVTIPRYEGVTKLPVRSG